MTLNLRCLKNSLRLRLMPRKRKSLRVKRKKRLSLRLMMPRKRKSLRAKRRKRLSLRLMPRKRKSL